MARYRPWPRGTPAGGVETGTIGRRKAYSETAIRDYRRSYRNFLRDVFGPMPADASAIYAWAITPSRRHATRNPLLNPAQPATARN